MCGSRVNVDSVLRLGKQLEASRRSQIADFTPILDKIASRKDKGVRKNFLQLGRYRYRTRLSRKKCEFFPPSQKWKTHFGFRLQLTLSLWSLFLSYNIFSDSSVFFIRKMGALWRMLGRGGNLPSAIFEINPCLIGTVSITGNHSNCTRICS